MQKHERIICKKVRMLPEVEGVSLEKTKNHNKLHITLDSGKKFFVVFSASPSEHRELKHVISRTRRFIRQRMMAT